jgi:hypothetical protein
MQKMLFFRSFKYKQTIFNMRLLIFAFLTMLSFKINAQTAEDIVAKYLDAVHLKGKIESLDAFQFSRLYKSNASTEYTETIAVQVKEMKYYKKKSILDRDFYYIFNSNAGFIKIPVGSRDKTSNFTVKDFNEKEKTDYQTEIKDGLLAFFNAEQKGYALSVSSESIDAESYNKISLEKTGIKRAFLFDKSTGLLKRESWTLGGITHTFTHNDYKETDGILLPVDSQYINTKDNKIIKVSTTWELNNPTKGVSFAR